MRLPAKNNRITAYMQNDNQKQALIYQRYDAAYKMLLRNPQAFCRFMQSLVDEALVQNLRPENIEMVTKVLCRNKVFNMKQIYFIRFP